MSPSPAAFDEDKLDWMNAHHIREEPIAVVVRDEDGQPVPRDGKTQGEIVMRGNNVMLGYYKDTAATDEAFKGGWFHSGDRGHLTEEGFLVLQGRLEAEPAP